MEGAVDVDKGINMLLWRMGIIRLWWLVRSLESTNYENKYKRKTWRREKKSYMKSISTNVQIKKKGIPHWYAHIHTVGAQPEKWFRAWISAPQPPLPTNAQCPHVYLTMILERGGAEGYIKVLVNIHLITPKERVNSVKHLHKPFA